MKFTFKNLIITLTLGFFALQSTTFAQPSIDELVPRPSTQTNSDQERYAELEAVGQLPEISIEGAISLAIKTVLRFAMILTMIGLVVMSIFMIKAQGDDEKLSQAKKIILYLVIGMAVIAASFGVVSGISQVDLFQ